MCASGYSEFIHLVSSQANEICDKESKKTISPEHIITALEVRLCSKATITKAPRMQIAHCDCFHSLERGLATRIRPLHPGDQGSI